MTSKNLVNLKYRLCNASKSSNAFIASMAHRQISGKIAHDSNPLSQVRTLRLKPSYHLFQTTALKFRRKQFEDILVVHSLKNKEKEGVI